MKLVSERIPHRYEVQQESIHRPFARHGRNTGPRLRFEPGSIDFHCPRLGVNQPGQLGAVRKPLLHLVAQHANPVGLRSKFNHEVRAHGPIAAEGSRIQVFDSRLEDPSRVWRTPGGVGQQPSRGRVECNASFVLTSPVAELAHDFAVSGTRPSEGLRHDDQFPVGGQFEIQIGMLGAELCECFVGHGTDAQDSRQVSLINDERHNPQYTPWQQNGPPTWGQNDDITVVTVRRAS